MTYKYAESIGPMVPKHKSVLSFQVLWAGRALLLKQRREWKDGGWEVVESAAWRRSLPRHCSAAVVKRPW